MNTDTPETDHLERNLGNAAHPVLSSFCRKLERERDEAQGQRDRLAELHNKNAIYFNELLELCRTLRKEQDTLWKALQDVIDEDGTPRSIVLANEILQSLTK